MRRTWLGVLALGLATLLGCTTTRSHKFKPPPLEEEYRLPPDDPRYSQAPRFPKETLNQAPKKPDLDTPAGGLTTRQPGMMGTGGSGMGGAGSSSMRAPGR